MQSIYAKPAAFACLLLVALLAATSPVQAAEPAASLAFPGAQGWAAHTQGGRGGKLIRVTTLDLEGPGSITEAIKTKGPRTVVFEVGGVIDLGVKTLRITEPLLTIAGQTAPAPGITFIRGGIDISTNDVVVRHIRVRPGDAGQAKRSGVDFDAISTVRARNIIVNHCTLTWGTDEGLSASGARFVEGGKTLEDFRNGTSRQITLSNNLSAEGLAYSGHGKRPFKGHAGGTLAALGRAGSSVAAAIASFGGLHMRCRG
jgi:pectate lyase